MVQLRTSLEDLVMQAWRERWTEIEWSIHLKAAVAENSSELDKLCGYLIRQGTLSEVPNKLMFNYLTFTIASQVVSHASLIQAVTQYTAFHKVLCVEAILDVLNLVREHLRCATVDAFHCQKLCSLLAQLFIWFTAALEYVIRYRNENLVGELITTMMTFIYNSFVSICLYFDKLENPDGFTGLMNRVKQVHDIIIAADWISDSYKQDFGALITRLGDHGVHVMPQIHLARFRDPVPQPTIISLAVLYGSVFLAEPLEALIEVLKNLREVQRVPWFYVIRDFIRGSFLLQQDCASTVPDSHLTAFVYLRIPRVIMELVQSRELPKDQLLEALRYVANFHPLFNNLDLKTRCDCFYFFLSELQKVHLVSDGELALLKEIRNRDVSSLTDSSPGSQATISLVLKAEPTLQTLLKSFHSEFAQKQEKLVQMMHHMISGKSFEFICAAAAATGHLSTFAGKLIDFNEASKKATLTDEKAEDAALRGELFDLSFLLLSRIVQLYSCSAIRQHKGPRGTFFEWWCSHYIDVAVRNRHGSTQQPFIGDNGAASAAMFPDKTDLEPIERMHDSDLSTEQCEEMLQNLRSQQSWLGNCNGDWNAICERIPQLGQLLLAEVRNEKISQEELKHVFSGLVLINANGVQWVCSFLLCLTQWLISCPPSEERKRLASSLHTFVESGLVSSPERSKVTDRQTFMANVAKRLLGPVLAPGPVPSPPYQWLNSVRRQIQMPLNTGVTLPPVDAIRHYMASALRQGWLGCSALSIVERCQRLGEHKLWIKIWFDELGKLSAADELNLWCNLCMACCLVDPMVTLVHFVDILATFVLETGRELFSVAPRGTSLSHFLVQLYLLGLRLCNRQQTTSGRFQTIDEPLQKMRKFDNSSDLSTMRSDASSSLRESFLIALGNLYRRFTMICEDGDLRPAVFFVGGFLRCLAEYHTPEARTMMDEIPHQLIGLLIRTDPNMLSASVILALSNLDDRSHRQRALANLCLLRQLKAL